MNMKDVKEITVPANRYRELEYIKFSGAEYVDTGLTGMTDKYLIIAASVDQSFTSPCYLFGVNGITGTTGANGYRVQIESSAMRVGWNNYTASISDWRTQWPANTKRYIKVKPELNTYEGTDYIKLLYKIDTAQSGMPTSFGNAGVVTAPTNTLYLMALNNNNSAEGYCSGKVYRFTEYQNNASGTLLHDFVPAQRKADGVCGVFDLVDETFIEMSGTNITTQAAGPVVNEKPTWDTDTVKKIKDSTNKMIWGSWDEYPYRQLEYIHFNGAEYILTVVPANNYYYLNFSLDSIVNDKFVFGTNGDSTSSGTMRITNRTASSGYYQTRYGRNSSSNTNIAQVSTNTQYQMRLRVFSDDTLYSALANSSGTVLGSNTFSAVSFTRANMYKFAIMGYNNNGTVGNMSAGKVYEYFVKETDGDSKVIVQAYPVQRKSDGKCGLFDIINGTFYPMEGAATTTTAAGPVVNEYFDINRPYRRLEYIHFSGAERIDTGITPSSNFYFLNAKVPPRSDAWSWIYGATHTVSGVAFRLFWQTNTPNTAYNRLKDLANENSFDLTNYQNSVIQFNIRNYFLNNTNGRYWFAAKDLGNNGLSDGNSATQIVGKYYNSSTYACDFMSFNTTISIGQQHTNNNWQSTGNRAIMDVYRHFIRVDTGTSDFLHDQYPCQRKADGVCGLYDVVTNTFYPMIGTTITTGAAGPTVDEDWDLTAPE